MICTYVCSVSYVCTVHTYVHMFRYSIGALSVDCVHALVCGCLSCTALLNILLCLQHGAQTRMLLFL